MNADVKKELQSLAKEIKQIERQHIIDEKIDVFLSKTLYKIYELFNVFDDLPLDHSIDFESIKQALKESKFDFKFVKLSIDKIKSNTQEVVLIDAYRAFFKDAKISECFIFEENKEIKCRIHI